MHKNFAQYTSRYIFFQIYNEQIKFSNSYKNFYSLSNLSLCASLLYYFFHLRTDTFNQNSWKEKTSGYFSCGFRFCRGRRPFLTRKNNVTRSTVHTIIHTYVHACTHSAYRLARVIASSHGNQANRLLFRFRELGITSFRVSRFVDGSASG